VCVCVWYLLLSSLSLYKVRWHTYYNLSKVCFCRWYRDTALSKPTAHTLTYSTILLHILYQKQQDDALVCHFFCRYATPNVTRCLSRTTSWWQRVFQCSDGELNSSPQVGKLPCKPHKFAQVDVWQPPFCRWCVALLRLWQRPYCIALLSWQFDQNLFRSLNFFCQYCRDSSPRTTRALIHLCALGVVPICLDLLFWSLVGPISVLQRQLT